MTETKKRKSGLKRAAPKKRARKAAAGSRGLLPAECVVDADFEIEIRQRIEKEGGVVLAAYRDPFGKNALIAVFDVDSDLPIAFDKADQAGLERILGWFGGR